YSDISSGTGFQPEIMHDVILILKFGWQFATEFQGSGFVSDELFFIFRMNDLKQKFDGEVFRFIAQHRLYFGVYKIDPCGDTIIDKGINPERNNIFTGQNP